jgi:outer membrane protein assembly factor BamA
VYRGVAGLVVPYGNATFAPYIKQYFAGGSTDNRAFRIRGVGPGSVPLKPDFETSDYFDQTGELKLGFNLEYRLHLFSYLKGAVFLDGGNIWLLKAQTGDPYEGVFKFDRFYNEIALGTGVGLRLDLNFFVLRVDASFPIYDPAYPMGNRWQLSDIQLFNPSWRQKKLVWNIAIGYPF